MLSAHVLTYMGNVMRADEAAEGRQVVLPGEATWLPRADWDDDCVVSLDGNCVRLVCLQARRPGHGAFHRLLDALAAEGLQPVVVEPLGPLEATLQRWGWCSRTVGRGIYRQRHWTRPRL
jgi:hypothetical protein